MNLLSSHACIRTGFLYVLDKVMMYMFHSISVTVCFSASFTSRILAIMRKFVANHVEPRLSRLNPLAWLLHGLLHACKKELGEHDEPLWTLLSSGYPRQQNLPTKVNPNLGVADLMHMPCIPRNTNVAITAKQCSQLYVSYWHYPCELRQYSRAQPQSSIPWLHLRYK